MLSLGQRQSGRGISAGSKPYNRNAPTAVTGRGARRYRGGVHLSFKVLMPIIANRIPRIQKRMTTFGSAQPSFSKW